MDQYANEIRKHWSIYKLFIKNCVMQQMEYRANFILNILVECLYVASKLLYVVIIYQVGSEVSGLTADQVTLFIGTFMILTAIYTGFFMDNLYAISQKVRRGDLDLMIVKPISLQFFVTLRGVNIALPIPNLIVGISMVCTAWSRIGIAVSVYHIAAYLLLLLCGVIITYSLFLLPQLLSFRMVKISAIVEITDKLWDFNNMPMSIYSKWRQRIGTFVIPVFCITNFPVMAVLGSMSVMDKVWALTVPVLLSVLVRMAWKRSIRHYSSAGG